MFLIIMRVITFGTFDLFHIGHLNVLKRCKDYGDYLIVGVSSDELNEKKGKKSIIPLEERLEIIKSIKYVDEVFVEECLEKRMNTLTILMQICLLWVMIGKENLTGLIARQFILIEHQLYLQLC